MAKASKAVQTEDDWEAESDARTLMEYVEIQGDAPRWGKAQKALGKLQEVTGEECVLVYTPTAPNPLSGYMLIIPKRLLTYVDMPVEDALSMVISSGSALPDSLRTIQIEEEKEKRSWLPSFRKRS